MNTYFDKDRRSVETIIEAGDGIQVSISTSHSKERKAYHTSLSHASSHGLSTVTLCPPSAGLVLTPYRVGATLTLVTYR